ncbi:MAG TPA: FUSC family protein [Mycobacterium sp.]|nr:FUSC family protein [Mycobacterium sp.]
MNWYEQAHSWAVGSDPGLLRLRTAVRTTATLGAALLVLYLLTRTTGQPVTVALLGVVIAMISARAVNEPDPRRQQITMALLPLPAALAITVSALLVPYRVAGDIVFVVIIFAAVYVRRFGSRGTALGMVTFMTYFFTLFLHTSTAELPWLILAVVVGALCSFVMTSYLLPDRPERVLRRTMRSLRARMAIVVDTAAEALRAGRLDNRRRRRLRVRTARLNETALMVQTQIEDKLDPAVRWPGVGAGDLALRLFDVQLTVERVARAAAQAAAVGTDLPAAARAELADALSQLARGVRTAGNDGLHRAAALAHRLADQQPGDPPHPVQISRLARAVIAVVAAVSEVRALIAHTAGAGTEFGHPALPAAPGGGDADPRPGAGGRGRLRPTTRQAIQVAIAASLAIVTGELVSPARWYWAVIAAFVIFAGTTSWGETLTKGWQRLLGTVLGVPSGVLVATAASGDTVTSMVLIFVCLFCAFYLMKVSYSLMIFWITTMLALLYGLLGQFNIHVLLLRIEETAIGAVTGVTVAVLVLPTNTRAVVRDDIREFWTMLSDLIAISVQAMVGGDTIANPTATARQLDRKLQQFRSTAKPLTAGVGGIANRRSIQRGLRVLTACDHYARTLASWAERPDAAADLAGLADIVTAASSQIRRNIDAVIAILDRRDKPVVLPAADLLDSADAPAVPGGEATLAALHALRQIDRAVVDTAVELGAISPVSSQ